MNWFRRRRTDLGMTQREVALAIGCTETCVANWERGLPPRIQSAPTLAKAYRADVDEVCRAISRAALKRTA